MVPRPVTPCPAGRADHLWAEGEQLLTQGNPPPPSPRGSGPEGWSASRGHNDPERHISQSVGSLPAPVRDVLSS